MCRALLLPQAICSVAIEPLIAYPTPFLYSFPVRPLCLTQGVVGEEADALLRFSLKESLYKALHPLLSCSIPWHSVTVWPKPDGSCVVDAAGLEQQLGVALTAEASWMQQGGFYVTAASAGLKLHLQTHRR